MMLIYNSWSIPILDEDYFSFYVIEKREEYNRFHQCLLRQLEGNEESFILSEKGKILNFFSLTEWIYSPWILDYEDRKLIAQLTQYLCKTIQSRGTDQEIVRKWFELEQLLMNEIIHEECASLDTDEMNLEYILKCFKPKFSVEEHDDLVENLENYIRIKRSYGKKKVFILDQGFEVFNRTDIMELANFAKREEIYLLMVASHYEEWLAEEKCRGLILDRDLCEILVQ